jgi:hypothetical protein
MCSGPSRNNPDYQSGLRLEDVMECHRQIEVKCAAMGMPMGVPMEVGVNVCNDVSGWFDAEGATYDCAWYSSDGSNCATYRSEYANAGHTANSACCVCGGGK